MEIVLEPVDFAPPAAPLNIAQFLPIAQSPWVSAPVGWQGKTPHPSPRRQIFCTVQGEYQVIASDGTVRHIPPGTVLFLEDTWGTSKSRSRRLTWPVSALAKLSSSGVWPIYSRC